MYDEHIRWKIWNQSQHPYKHSLTEFFYTNPATPGVTNIESALNWILAVLYPNSQDSVADVASLPLVGNTINDYRVVLDDGDGKAAAYRWEQREGEGSPSWHKIYDMDWGEQSILSNFLIQTQDIYVNKYGRDDVDASGNLVAGVLAGQSIYGGVAAGSSLTLFANAGDGVGPNTGYIQFGDNVAPLVNATFALGESSRRFTDGFFSSSVVIGTSTFAPASITDSTGTISFDNENLTTSGNITGAILKGSSLVADDGVDTATITPGSYADTTGSIAFGGSNFTSVGTIASGTITVGSDLVLAVGSITSVSGTISFGDENLTTTGNITGTVGQFGQVNVDNLRLDNNALSITNLNGNLELIANGTGVIDLQSAAQTLSITTTGTHTITGQFNADNLRIDGNTISSTNLNGDITLSPNGTGVIRTSTDIIPNSDNAYDLGATALAFNELFLKGGISDGTNSVLIAVLLAFRDAITGANSGDVLFYDTATGRYLPSAPDTEIDHTALSNLTVGDSGHTQFVMLAGRAGGQTIQGGTLASNNLVLESTANATKGSVLTKDHFLPFTDASYSGGWSGTDLGASLNNFRDVYSKGEFFGFRFQNVTSGTLPSASAQNVGRVVYATDNAKAYIDTGSAFKVLGVSKHVEDLAFNGSDTLKDVDVSANITDARTALIQLLDNANDFERLFVRIKATSASNVRIQTAGPLPAGTYRLVVIE